MAIGRITYANKVDYRQEGQDDKYKITAENMNEIKRVFNNSAEAIEKGLSTIDENVKKTNDARDLAKQYMEQASQDALAINGTANGITQELTITDGYAQLTDTATKRLDSLVIKGNTVQNSTKGLNLINCTPKMTTINGITMVNNGDGTYTVNGTATDDFDIALAPYTTKQNIYYTLSGCPSGGSKTTYYLDPRGYEYDTGRGTTIINPNQDFSNYIRIVIKKDVTVNNLLFKPMFNEGQTAQPFEPYTGGKPSPNPEYPQEIKAVNELSGVMSGKNLLKPYGSYPKTGRGITLNLMNDGIHVNGKCIDSSWHTFIYSDTLQAGTYYINGIKGASNSHYQVVLYKNSAILNYITTNNFKLELKEKSKIELSLFVYSGYGTFNDLVLPYMICRNENDLYLYTPYQGQSLLNYTLQNPLYKIGDVYDYIDFNRGKIVRNVGIIEFDGSSDELWNKYSNNVSMDGYSVNVSNAIDDSNCICDKLLSTESISTETKESIKLTGGNRLFVILNKSRGLDTVDLFKNWLSQNPITVVYQLATPTEEDIPAELLSQLKELQTYVTTTNVMFDASDVYPIVDLEYIADTKTYIDNKFKELAEVIITSTSEEEL